MDRQKTASSVTRAPLTEMGPAPAPESQRVALARRALGLLVEVDHDCRDTARRELFAEDFVIEVPSRGGCQVYNSLERGEFRRGEIEIVEMVESGSRVLSHVRLDVLRRHEVDGELVTQDCSADGIITYEFEGDLIVRAWSMLRWR